MDASQEPSGPPPVEEGGEAVDVSTQTQTDEHASGPDGDSINTPGTAFEAAVKEGNVEKLDELLTSGDSDTLLTTPIAFDLADGDETVNISLPPLNLAVALKYPRVVELFRKYNAPAEAETPNWGGTALHLAARYGCLESARLLVKAAEINQADSPGNSPLHIASKNGYKEIVSLLLDEGADIAQRNRSSMTAFMIAARFGHLEVLKLLWDRGPKTQIEEISEETRPIHYAVAKGSVETVEWLLSVGTPIDQPDVYGNTPLLSSCINAAPEVASYLVGKGADLHARNKFHNSPILLASLNLQPLIFDKLVRNGARVSDVDKSGNTCYHSVVNNKEKFGMPHRNIITRLIGEGLSIDTPDASGFTPLMSACISQKIELVKCLLSFGANINLQVPATGGTALMEACCKPDRGIVDVLISHKADMTMKNHHRLTALVLACRFGRHENAKALLAAGAETRVRTREQHSPIYAAIGQGHVDAALVMMGTTHYYPAWPAETEAFTEVTRHVPEVENNWLKNMEGRTREQLDLLMYWAVANGAIKLAEACVEKDKDVLNWRRGGATWLHVAALHGRFTLMKDLLSGIDVLEEAVGRISALYAAAKAGSYDCVHYLLGKLSEKTSEELAHKKVSAIIDRNSKGESPLSISVIGRHTKVSTFLFSEIESFGNEHDGFMQSHSEQADSILEALAQYEKPGNETILGSLLRKWFPEARKGARPGFTTLHWAVQCDQPVVVWWLLSKGGYSNGEWIEEAEELALEKKGKIGEVLLKLFERPPAILPHVANPNDSQPPEIPIISDEENPSLSREGTIIDIHSDGQSVSVSYARHSIEKLVYTQGPDAIMEDAMNLDQRHLDSLKQELNEIKAANKGEEQHPPRPVLAQTDSQNSDMKRSDQTSETHRLRWIHIPVNELVLMRDLVTRLSHDSGRTDMDHNILMRHFNRSWVELAAGGGNHYMKPQCVQQQISHLKNASKQTMRDPKMRSDDFCKAIYMPYLTLGDYQPQASSKSLPEQQNRGGSDLQRSRKNVVGNSRQVVHHTMTLDQYYYPTIRDTTDRDTDQVVSKFIATQRDRQSDKPATQGPGQHRYGMSSATKSLASRLRGATGPEKMQILIIGQIWIWVIDEKTIITAATEAANEASPGNLFQSALDSIIYGESRGRFERPTSSDAMMKVILSVATGFFMKKIVDVSGYNRAKDNKGPLEIFREAIRDVSNEETRLFRNFAKGLREEEEERNKIRQKSLQRPSVRETPHNPHHIISAETELLDSIRDIRDELHMLRSLAEDQDSVWKQAFDQQEHKSSFLYYHTCMPLDVKEDIEEMLLEAEMTNDSINTLLDLRQKQASIKEAEFGRLQANDSARQSNSIFVFTVITIIFLPLSFLSSMFALDVSDFPHESGELKYKGWWLFPILFGVSAVVSIPAILLAWKVNSLSSWLRLQTTSLHDRPIASASQTSGLAFGAFEQPRRRRSTLPQHQNDIQYDRSKAQAPGKKIVFKDEESSPAGSSV